MSKYESAWITIIIHEFLPEDVNIGDILGKLYKQNQEIYAYYAPNDNKFKKCPIIIVDTLMSNKKAQQYYLDIINYWLGDGDKLSENYKYLRFEEISNKWLNGNFNCWLLDSDE